MTAKPAFNLSQRAGGACLRGSWRVGVRDDCRERIPSMISGPVLAITRPRALPGTRARHTVLTGITPPWSSFFRHGPAPLWWPRATRWTSVPGRGPALPTPEPRPFAPAP